MLKLVKPQNLNQHNTYMKKRINIYLFLASFLLIQACGTIIHGTTQQVGISSSPSSAVVSINGQNVGETPVIIDLKRKDSHFVKIDLPGYQTYETTLSRKVSGWVWGNIVFGGIIGLVVDASTGGMYKLTPEQIEAELRGGQANLSDTKEGLFIAIMLKVDPNWEKVGNLEAVK